MRQTKVFCIPDTHFPFHNKEALDKIIEAIKLEKPTHIVHLGDLLDQYVFSRYPRSMSITPKADIIKGLKLASKMWQNIKKVAPKALCYQILGNHDIRLNKKISDKMPEVAELLKAHDLYKFDGVKVLKSDRDFLTISGVVYVHGWYSKSIDHAKFFNKPCVHGHRHRPGIETDGKIWSMDCGFIANEKSLPLQYTMSKFSKWRMAYGIVENKIPKLVLL